MKGLIDRLEERLTFKPSTFPRLLDESTGRIRSVFGAYSSSSGVSVDERRALSWSALDAAVQIVATTIATLPMGVKRRLDRGREDMRDHSLWRVLSERPNPEQSPVEFWETYVSNIMLWGNGLAKIVYEDGQITEVWPLNPDRVRILRRKGDAKLIYQVTLPSSAVHPRQTERKQNLFAEEVFHTRGFAPSGIIGSSLADKHRETIGLGLVTERYVAQFFGQGATPGGVLEVDDTLSDAAHKRMKDDWNAEHGGWENSHGVAILEEGAKFRAIMADPEKAQATELRKLNITEASRITRVPPHMLAELSRATFSNIEQQSLNFIIHTIRPWQVRIEKRAALDLLREAERRSGVFVKINTEGLLRGDSKARANFYNTLVNIGALSPNEVREKEDMNPVEGGDQRFVPLNMVPLSEAGGMPTDERARLLAAESGALPRLEGREVAALQPPAEHRAVRERQRLIQRIGPTIGDAMERMVRGEVRNLRGQADRLLTGDDPSTFLAWMRDYYFGNEDELVGEADAGDGHPEFIRRVVGPVFATYIPQVVDAAAAEVGEAMPENERSRWVDSYVTKFARRYSASSRRQLQKELREAATEPDTSPRAKLDQRTGEWLEGGGEARPRAERWAKGEANRANNATMRQMAMAAGLSLVWVSVGESCPFCNELDGTRVGTRSPFLEQGQQFQPAGAESALSPRDAVLHPPIHDGCDCMITVG